MTVKLLHSENFRKDQLVRNLDLKIHVSRKDLKDITKILNFKSHFIH